MYSRICVLLLGVFLMGCQKMAVSEEVFGASEKREFLVSNSVFSDAAPTTYPDHCFNDGINTCLEQPETPADPNINPPVVENPPAAETPAVPAPANAVCTDNNANVVMVGPTGNVVSTPSGTGARLDSTHYRNVQVVRNYLVDATSLSLVYFKRGNRAEVCRLLQPELKDSLMNKKVLELRLCPGMQNGDYTVEVYSQFNASVGLKGSSGYPIRVENGNIKLERNKSFTYALDANRSQQRKTTIACESQSPLVVDLGNSRRDGTIDLTSRAQGILFDIMGLNAKPVAHTPSKVSWFHHRDLNRYGFIALPNSTGEVNGINELFGNNTSGPDGRFASDGYAALAKYDFNKDEVIDRRDPIYSKLVVWFDSDRNGLGRGPELVRLPDVGIVAIDLRYDIRYLERDRHGNETRFKSVVRMKDDTLRLLFDLWFNLD